MPVLGAVIYARYSSDNQRDASIDDQLRECHAWAKAHDVHVIGEYCDRAISGRTDDRPQFQQMITDAEKGLFSAVIMYQTSRFARDRYLAAIYKHRLKKAGVTVHYAATSIPEGPEGIILEALMEGMDEYYSANLAINIKRGQHGNALKAIAMNRAPLGLRINADRQYEPDPDTAPHVLRAFQMIDEGMMQKDVCDYFNGMGLRTSTGTAFSKSSFHHFFRNRKYIGEYIYNDIVIPDAIQAIVPLDLFERVQVRIDANKHTSGGRKRSVVEFLLTGKLYCGHCQCAMVGDGGTSKTGAVHHYYTCITRKRKRACNKATERQLALEKAIVQETISHVLQPDVMARLIDCAMELQRAERDDDPVLRTLQDEQRSVETSLRNLLRAIEDGLYTSTTKRRMEELEQQQADLASRIAAHQAVRPVITRDHLQFFLESFRDGNADDPDYRRRVIEALVHSVTISDTPDPDGSGKTLRTLHIAYNLTDNNTSSTVFDVGSEFGCGAECSTIRCSSELFQIYLSAGVFVMSITTKTPV